MTELEIADLAHKATIEAAFAIGLTAEEASAVWSRLLSSILLSLRTLPPPSVTAPQHLATAALKMSGLFRLL